ncbi:MAG TPA: hypothetical protein VFB38_02855 [Chthonomonadaceae bacterium]|nr:hypothetical protein [Chthonomonadaceae bacterium]
MDPVEDTRPLFYLTREEILLLVEAVAALPNQEADTLLHRLAELYRSVAAEPAAQVEVCFSEDALLSRPGRFLFKRTPAVVR